MDDNTDEIRKHNEHLRTRLREEQQQTGHLREEVARWKRIAEKAHTSWIRTHSALNLVVQDAQQVMEKNGAAKLHRTLLEQREIYERLYAKRQQWRDLARRATEAKVTEAQRARELDELVEELRQRLVETERQRDAAVEKAERVIADQQAKLDRIEDQCRLWKRGELDTMTTIAGITGEFTGHPLPDSGVWDRQRALRRAEVMSMLNRATDQLHQIEARLNEQGIRLVTTHDQMVADYIDRMTGRVEAAEDRGR